LRRNVRRIGFYGYSRCGCVTGLGNCRAEHRPCRPGRPCCRGRALIALDLQTVLQEAGATVIRANTQGAAQAAERPDISAAVLDARPGSSDHRPIARLLKRRGIPFLFYATHEPEEVTTTSGSPTVLKPGRPEKIVAVVATLLVTKRS
jgi:hypothetical protein